jgi:hypothetical protein
MGFSGGVEAQQMTADTFRIVARGNAYTGTNTVQDYTMLKAAETTKQNGGTHFVVISAADASGTSQITTPGYAQTSIIGNTATTTYTPGTSQTVFKPGQDAYIRILSAKPNQPMPAGAILADEIIQFVGGRVQRG